MLERDRGSEGVSTRSFRFVLCGLVFTVAGIVSTQAQDKGNIDERLNASAVVIEEVMAAPDHVIPETVLGGAHCVIVIPSEKKAAGAQYCQGAATCRTGHGWSAPVFIKLGGVSFGLQIGGQTTNLGLLCALPSHHSG
jgi:lipid-binding SYLF domain-containing protein